MYTSRKLRDPSCVYHDFADEITEALEAARAAALEDAAKVCDRRNEEYHADVADTPKQHRVQIPALIVKAVETYECADAIRALASVKQ